MGRADLLDDPRFTTNPARTENMAATEALVTAWTIGLGKAEVAAAAKRYRIPVAPVRNAIEVMNDPHMHERGMLQRIDHPSLGPIVVPNSPLRLHGSERVEPVPSPSLGQHNADVYGGWLGLDVAALQQAGAI
jgi:crotonobetainyl-CoA:carnitine CoA-transferase CaiB-like acyl-CoA transferase